ncbi:MAG: helix-turn-helix domain-containing protein [Chloroflexota bacterium]|nr:helix-turn-helix domain-containing protein [Chloroflexota bacterium]
MTDRLGFGEAVRAVRKSRAMTQAELAERAGITRTHLVRIEGQRKWPQHHQGLLRALGFTLGAELMAAAVAERQKFVRRPTTAATCCESCGTRIDPSASRSGRPRLRCPSCAADRSALAKRWRAANPDRVEAYNRARRERALA